METNRKLEQVESSEEFVEDSQEITTDIGYLNEITIENINYIFDTLHEDRFYLKPYQELEDLSKIKLTIQQGKNITDDQKSKYLEICNKHKMLLKLE